VETETPVRHKYRKFVPVILVVTVLGLVVVGLVIKPIFSGTNPATEVDATAQDVPITFTLAQAEVSITSRGFSPQTVTIKKGQAVSWTNKTFIKHQITSDVQPVSNGTSGFKGQGALLQTDLFLVTFKTAGTFTYHDELNPSLTGTVVVQ
jgi:plastocyanin